LELLILLIPKVVLHLVVALLVGVVSFVIVIVVLVGRVELLPLGSVDDEVGGVTALEAAPK
jgi:hypothetical protein